MAKKISFPLGDGNVPNGYFNPTSQYQKSQQKRNAKKVAKRYEVHKSIRTSSVSSF